MIFRGRAKAALKASLADCFQRQAGCVWPDNKPDGSTVQLIDTKVRKEPFYLACGALLLATEKGVMAVGGSG